MTGDVTFPKTTMRTADAAAEIARQTHTRWRVYYALTPNGMALRGKVVDHNNGGQAIVQLPFTYYGSKTRPNQTVARPPNGRTRRTRREPSLAVAADGSNPVTYDGPNNGGPVGFGPVAGGAAIAPYSYVPPLGYGYGQMPFTYGNGYSYMVSVRPTSRSTATSAAAAIRGAMAAATNGGVSILPGSGGYGPFGGYGAPITF